MNKKIIKYLIWIILITATLILMPTKETMAATTVTYNEFKNSENFYCLNKGDRFSSSENFEVSTITGDFNWNNVPYDRDLIEYIITEASTTYSGRTSIGKYIPQHAIWKLVSGPNIIASAEGDKLLAEAYAYNSFISNKKNPIIEKEGSDKVVIYYYETTSTYNGQSGSYTNLDSISVTGATYTSGPTTCNYNGYNMKYTYTKNEGATQAEVTVSYETKRDATLQLYAAQYKETSVELIVPADGNVVMLPFQRINNQFYHIGCSYSQDPCAYVTGSFSNGVGSKAVFECLCGNSIAVYNYTNGTTQYKLNDEVDFILSEVYGGYYPQNLLYGSGNITTDSKTETIKFGVNLTINKTDSLLGTRLPGARFRIDLTNVSSIDNYQVPTDGATQNSPRTVYVTTDGNGQIKLTGILPNDFNTAITATITEVGVPTVSGWYYIVNSNPITVTITHNNGTWYASGGGVTVSDATVSVPITNQPYIDLRGNVWQDAQTGDKNVSGANGLKDTGEDNLQGVIVQLHSVKEGRVISKTETDQYGNYAFNTIPRTLEGFKIIFRYNGITYVETPQGTVSKPDEVGRTAFNNRFKTISKGKSNDGTALQYTYNNEKSTLNANIAGHTTGTTDAKFQMSAQTPAYNTTSYDVNCGLVKKNFDLAIGTDVKSAKLKINEKETTYSYAQIMDGALNAEFDEISSNVKRENNEEIIYNLYLYSSDYNYRIDDYKTDIETNNAVNSGKPQGGYTQTDGNNNTDRVNELEAYVTYSVILKAQTTQNATVEQFVYYYDEAYTPYNIVSTDKYDVSIDTNARKITFTSKNGGFKLTSPNYRVEVDLTFKINEDANGNLIVNETATNIAEITKYSTDEGGLIDRDSAPENGITNGKITQYEDDTDEAKGLNIVLRTDETRIITGTVFDDTAKKDEEGNASYDKDGKLNNENSRVNDVIVQLIEIKKISGKYYEYIWQETRSGSNQVKTTARNGYEGTTYTNSVTEDGKYEFKDFIPGNYIIRYIYGDGTTYDVTDNVKKYNGQDYKSTIDQNYNKPWYNTAGYTAGDSIARDNEARRLEVMTYSTTINGTNGAHLANKTNEALENTWMCAETSRINIPVDADNTDTDANNTTASYDYTNKNTKVLFGDMNFGLALRPQENIVLEKHITALKITPSGTGVQSIVDAKAEGIEKIVNGVEVKVEGVTDGLATIKSTQLERGFWQVATDVEELMQGAELEVEYTYVIRNDSEENYLSNTLIEAYENQDIKPYNQVLSEVKNTVKGTMRSGTYSYSNSNTIGTYLGEFYYIGTKGASDELVSARVEKFEEALNNDLAFDETAGTSFKTARQASKEQVYGVDKAEGTKETEINTVVENVAASTYLTPKLEENYTTETADWSKTITLRTTLATVGGGELGANLPSYIAEVLQYSNAAGRKDMTATPANLQYVHSDDTTMTLDTWQYELDGTAYTVQGKENIPENATNIVKLYNEQDEFWAESIIITKPTGEDKLSPLQIVLITISAIAALGVGIVLIKKYVLKK